MNEINLRSDTSPQVMLDLHLPGVTVGYLPGVTVGYLSGVTVGCYIRVLHFMFSAYVSNASQPSFNVAKEFRISQRPQSY